MSFEEDDMLTGYCFTCGEEATESPVDIGIGPYEFAGHAGLHEDVRLLSPCCEAQVVKHYEETDPGGRV
tara:strand:- start:536 stop:742 length:207 start_codon:yes stop_codon:yes gene_type:complete